MKHKSRGRNTAKKNANNLTILSKLEYWYFKFWSSGDDRKSTNTAGTIRANGDPLIKMETLPSNIRLEALSGLSVATACGKATEPVIFYKLF